MLFCKHSYTFLQISHGLHFSDAKNLVTDLCLRLKHCVWSACILNIPKITIFPRLKYFSLTLFQTIQFLRKKNLKNNLFCSLKKVRRNNKLKRTSHIEAVHMLGYCDQLRRPSIEMNLIWEPLIKNSIKKLRYELR